jgi:hypothetical protein
MDIQSKRQAIDAAYRRGDHLQARALSREALADEQSSDELRALAQRVLRETGTDPFIFAAAVAGLGLIAWLVYKYSQ